MPELLAARWNLAIRFKSKPRSCRGFCYLGTSDAALQQHRSPFLLSDVSSMRLNPLQWSFRLQSFAVFAVCAALIGFAILSERIWDLIPCPLCMFQRVAFGGLGLIGLIAALHAPKSGLGRKFYGLLALFVGGAGIGVAGRHVWLTTLPADQVPACGQPLAFMMEQNPFADVLKMVLTGSGECAKVDWHFGLSMPAWSLVWLVVITLFALYATFKRPAPAAP
jgi:protein dithiol:quinone oxidoreductase